MAEAKEKSIDKLINLRNDLKEKNSSEKVKTALSNAKNKVITATKPQYEKFRENVLDKYKTIKARIGTAFAGLEGKIKNHPENPNEYIPKLEEYEELSAQMNPVEIQNNLETYENTNPKDITPEMVIMADALNDEYRDKTGKENEEYIEKQQETISYLENNKDDLIQNGHVNEEFFQILDLIKLKVEIALGDYTENQKRNLIVEIQLLTDKTKIIASTSANQASKER